MLFIKESYFNCVVLVSCTSTVPGALTCIFFMGVSILVTVRNAARLAV